MSPFVMDEIRDESMDESRDESRDVTWTTQIVHMAEHQTTILGNCEITPSQYKQSLAGHTDDKISDQHTCSRFRKYVCRGSGRAACLVTEIRS